MQFLQRNVKIDRLGKYNKDSKWSFLKKSALYPSAKFVELTDKEIDAANRIIDAHVGIGKNQRAHRGDWRILQQLLSLAFPQDDVEWATISGYWQEFKTGVAMNYLYY